jgi:hypothetical protein
MRLLLLVGLLVGCARSAYATPQIKHTVLFGNKTYVLDEIPMLGLWDYGAGNIGTGKQKPPEFDFLSSANNTGYQAEFEIRDSKFWLRQLTGQIAGQPWKNDEIIPGERFPIVAKWFSGRIHLAVGGFDEERQENISVIIFHVHQGTVTRSEYVERMKRTWTWNGLGEREKPEPTTVELSGIGVVTMPPGKWLLERIAAEQNKQIYLFETDGPRLERLSFQMFQGDTAKSLEKRINSIGEGVVNGIPQGVLKAGEVKSGASQILLPITKVNDTCLAKTSICTVENGVPWINHVTVCGRQDGVLVCVHASPHVISPDVVKEVCSKLNESGK